MKKEDFEFRHYHKNGVTGIVNMCDVLYKGEQRFSISLGIVNSNFHDYINRIGCTPNELVRDASYYGELAVMMHDCWMLECQYPLDEKATEHLQHFNTGSGYGLSVTADHDLTDEEKFMCALIVCDDSDYGLTSKILGKMYGWSTYKARKVARSIRHKFVGTLINEEREGYFGKGWLMERAMHTLFNNYRRSVLDKRKSAAVSG